MAEDTPINTSLTQVPVPIAITKVMNRLGGGFLDVVFLMPLIGVAQHYAPSAMSGASNVLTVFVYYSITLSIFSRTPGQMLFGDLVITERGKHLTVGTSLKRAAWITISYIFAGLPFLLIFFNEKRQTLHDKLAHTLVVHQSLHRVTSPSGRY